jgi:hypothetical protein
MNHADLYLLRETFNAKQMLLCFNGPFSQGLIEEFGNALKKYLNEETDPATSALDVFGAFVEITQNIRNYSIEKGYSDKEASATVVISRDGEGRYVISAGNIVEPSDGEALAARLDALAAMDKAQLKAAYKEQLRKPRGAGETAAGAGLGLIDVARKSSAPFSHSLHPVNAGGRLFFSLQVVL